MYSFVGRFLCDAGGPYTGKPGQPIQFDGSARYGTQPYTWAWDFGDGATSTEQNPTHTYTDPGTYTVSLEVTDAASNTTTDSTTATIMICDAGGPYAGDVNEDIQFSGSASGGVTPY